MSAALSHCIILPEILDIVCLYLSRSELACLARTCSFFFNPAIRQLWSSGPVEDKNILNLLPNSLVFHYGEKENETKFEVNIPTNVPSDYFDRLNIYAPYVRHMNVSLAWSHDEEYYHHRHLPGWRTVACHARKHVLLPNLRRVELMERYSTTTSSRPCSDWLSILIPPSLRDLDLFRNFVDDSPGCIERYLDLMDSVFNRCSNHLERLRIYTIEPSISQLTAQSPNDPASRTLVPGALVSRALKHVVRMPQLRELQMPELSPHLEIPDLPKTSTCRLNSLRMSCGSIEPLFRLWQTPIPAHLTQLTLSTIWPSNTTAVTEMHELASLIAAQSPDITKLHFYFDEIPDTQHLMDVLYPLHKLHLTELIVNGIQLTQPPQRISLRKVAEYWPLLEVLEIKHAGTTFNELITVSSYLPRLNCLLLQLESVIPSEIISGDAIPQPDTRPTQELELVSDFRCVHKFNPVEADAFAKFLTKIWRSLNIKCYCRGYKHGPEYEEFKVTLAQHLNGSPPSIPPIDIVA
ncbi:hypothetical protein CTheo_7669 [Ceratobasidium theobromae]|uniref:F-box domain-containing protein n=1 Tax=Ceratobasidium theobromae TaxID=1582974 RepID=A0A5N5QBK7_9AGAM|nr:hypothetical protein CTheo_7669 [Ceratobasidium theobromae]